MSSPKDPKRYYRIEAREIVDGMSAELLALSKGETRPEATSRLFRQAHTLKGAATVVGDTAVVETARILEDVLGAHRETKTHLSLQEVTEFLHIAEALDGMLTSEAQALPAGIAAQSDEPGTAASSPDALTTVRVELDELDGVTSALTGAELQSSALLLALRDLETTTRSLEGVMEECLAPMRQESHLSIGSREVHLRDVARESLDRLERTRRLTIARAEAAVRELQQAREHVGRLQLVAAATAFPSLERATQLASSALGKTVRLDMTGGDVRLDRRILPVVGEAFLHLVRNAVDHGIESATERVAAGKSADGCVKVSVQRRGNRVVFACEDDGKGIDANAIRRLAADSGILPAVEAERLDDAAALRLLFRAGVSTRTQITDLSGRGVGLDVVRAAALTLHGDATITSQHGHGTRVELVVPVSLSTAAVVALRIEATTVLLPLDSIRRVVRISPTEVARSSNGEAVPHEGELLPVLRLGPALGLGSSCSDDVTTLVALVIAVGDERCAVVADAVLGNSDVVVRPLPWAAGNPIGVAGAALDAEGAARLVLDPRGLVAISQRHSGVAPEPPAPARVRHYLPILVVDDSLTTRMLEQSILQTAGFEVDVATSAEEGLGMARAREYGLFVVDVEMPKMNGFEFTALTRNDSRLKDTAVILVTSLNSETDKRKGREAGAAAYVVKGQFNQNHFLDQVRKLSRAEA